MYAGRSPVLLHRTQGGAAADRRGTSRGRVTEGFFTLLFTLCVHKHGKGCAQTVACRQLPALDAPAWGKCMVWDNTDTVVGMLKHTVPASSTAADH